MRHAPNTEEYSLGSLQNKHILVAKLDIYLYPNPLVCEFAITTVIPTDTPSRHNVSNMSLSCKYKSFNAVKLSINKII